MDPCRAVDSSQGNRWEDGSDTRLPVKPWRGSFQGRCSNNADKRFFGVKVGGKWGRSGSIKRQKRERFVSLFFSPVRTSQCKSVGWGVWCVCVYVFVGAVVDARVDMRFGALRRVI